MIDLSVNLPILEAQHGVVRCALAAAFADENSVRRTALGGALEVDTTTRSILSEGLARSGWRPAPEMLVLAPGAKHALAAALEATVPRGGILGVEVLSYPTVRVIAAELGIRCRPLAMDDGGIRPDAVLEAHVQEPLAAVYLQPTLHNPLGMTMSAARRRQVAEAVSRCGILAIEDTVFEFLCPDAPPPLAAFAPKSTVLIDSLSKRLSPGLNLGFAVAPDEDLGRRIHEVLDARRWEPAGLAVTSARTLMATGVLTQIVQGKRSDAALRNAQARRSLAGREVEGHAGAYHLWLSVPAWPSAAAFAAAAAAEGVLVAPADGFHFAATAPPKAVRIALGGIPLEVLESALGLVADLAGRPPGGGRKPSVPRPARPVPGRGRPHNLGPDT
ncbi:MAG: aminotransferase class I/II-fold pyridoxal phosphate-dependent enzyme [Phenylobacterium sp.]|uniref:aminotransferase class I/II-fold pyridoxal phosphate-dependent enzyme n=1 Tax=Phenylobacterium sp. TaxID=1871053 RepID=UPI002736C6AC|nr:aminotransferase class I/II-fold pyridoxal phosphate-dependent enzyme [Phenylobacterium sp.]MDP3745638.1 aminotransferase class I/II-fold pyridoxal phosphate-dependent enzyme [Phenylobacterium sp.]